MIPSIKEDPLMQAASKVFDICHGVTLILKHDGYVDFAYYGTSSDNEEINVFYINNFHVLNVFLLYFIEKAQPLILEAEKHRFKIEGRSLTWENQNLKSASPIRAYVESISEQISPTESLKIKRYYLSGNIKNTYLSRREAECLSDLFDGLSAKGIARKRMMSSRTVEVHIEHIKLKLKCSTRSEMIDKAKTCGLEQIYKAIRASEN